MIWRVEEYSVRAAALNRRVGYIMEDDTDRKTIEELKSMALQYKNRGNPRKAAELLALAEKIEERLKRGQKIVEINNWQEGGGQRIG